MILLDQLRIGHAGDAALGADHGGHAFEGHHGDCASLFGDARLLDVHHVHDDAALEHLGEAELQPEVICAGVGSVVSVLSRFDHVLPLFVCAGHASRAVFS